MEARGIRDSIEFIIESHKTFKNLHKRRGNYFGFKLINEKEEK